MLTALPIHPASLIFADTRAFTRNSTLASNVRGGLKARGGTNGPLGRGIISIAAAFIVGYTAYALYKGGDTPAHRHRRRSLPSPAQAVAAQKTTTPHLPLFTMDNDCLESLEWCMIYGA